MLLHYVIKIFMTQASLFRKLHSFIVCSGVPLAVRKYFVEPRQRIVNHVVGIRHRGIHA